MFLYLCTVKVDFCLHPTSTSGSQIFSNKHDTITSILQVENDHTRFPPYWFILLVTCY